MWRYRLPVSPGYGLNTLMVILIALFVVGIIVAMLWSRRNQTDWEDQHEEANRKARSAAPPTAETKKLTEEDLRRLQKEDIQRRTLTLEEALAKQEENKK
ncbi:MAG: hypothetical protein IJX52_04510 [Oscillibacter sp.]|nr:hypothetical protein [Oscillibacter sp.]